MMNRNFKLTRRKEGSGIIKLDTIMKPNEDIYALIFASYFRLEAIDKHRWDKKVKDDAEDETTKKY